MIFHPFPVIDLPATGANIRRLRQARGLSIRDLQQFFGFKEPQAIYKWQRGQNLPTVDNLYALSILLDVPMNDILVAVNRPNRCTISGRPEPAAPFFRPRPQRHDGAFCPLRRWIGGLRSRSVCFWRMPVLYFDRKELPGQDTSWHIVQKGGGS